MPPTKLLATCGVAIGPSLPKSCTCFYTDFEHENQWRRLAEAREEWILLHYINTGDPLSMFCRFHEEHRAVSPSGGGVHQLLAQGAEF
jgi:hypothetical protein